jgi:hypothetical protein
MSQDVVPDPRNPKVTLSSLGKGTVLVPRHRFRQLPADLFARRSRPRWLANQKNEDLSFTNLDAAKGGAAILDPSLTTPYSMQYTLGIQRELPYNILISADGVIKQSVHEIFSADYNKNNHVGGNGRSTFERGGFLSDRRHRPIQSPASARRKALLEALSVHGVVCAHLVWWVSTEAVCS